MGRGEERCCHACCFLAKALYTKCCAVSARALLSSESGRQAFSKDSAIYVGAPYSQMHSLPSSPGAQYSRKRSAGYTSMQEAILWLKVDTASRCCFLDYQAGQGGMGRLHLELPYSNSQHKLCKNPRSVLVTCHASLHRQLVS